MTKICHVTTVHNVWDTRIFRRECVSLAKAGFQVMLVAVHDKEEIVDGVQIIPLARARSVIERRLLLSRRAMEIARNLDADLYHFHDPELIPSMRRLARKTGKPVIWDAHEVYIESIYHFNQFKFRPISALGAHCFDRLERAACVNEFAGVVTITDLMAERYRSLGVDTCVLGNFPDITTSKNRPEVTRAARPRIISTGGHFLDRGVFELVEAFLLARKELPCDIAFWGSFAPPELENQLKERLLETGNVPAEDIIIDGPVPWKTLMEELIPTGWAGAVLYSRSDPDLLNGLPNRFFEYWANQVPVIVTAGSVVGQIAEEVGGGITVETQPKAIANAFLELARNPALVETMGAAGRKAVEQKYNWNVAFQELVSFYARLGVTATTPVAH